MPNFLCVTCGTQYPASDTPPDGCPICLDDRQYVNPNGQQWTTLEELRAGGRRNRFELVADGVTAIVTEPGVGIGQRAHLIETPRGNVLWDCVAYLDDETVAEVRRRGGLQAIAISHPHFYTTIVEWSRALDVPVYLHRDNQPWVMRPDEDAVRYWDGETLALLPGVTYIRCGGHFPGSSVLHWAEGAAGKGALFTGDTIYVVADPRWVTFMYSYPNDIPLNASAVRRIVAAVEPFAFDTLYSSFGRAVQQDARGAVRRSAERYIEHITG
jgi:glyoxylase-like metal-dependent hydrolase (beta-lactamase superfamily II)